MNINRKTQCRAIAVIARRIYYDLDIPDTILHPRTDLQKSVSTTPDIAVRDQWLGGAKTQWVYAIGKIQDNLRARTNGPVPYLLEVLTNTRKKIINAIEFIDFKGIIFG